MDSALYHQDMKTYLEESWKVQKGNETWLKQDSVSSNCWMSTYNDATI
jgi:hypothetical protein